jgi:hypothetical protein
VISGTSTADQFYSSVRSRWRFVNPEEILHTLFSIFYVAGIVLFYGWKFSRCNMEFVMDLKLKGTIGGR